jgi:dTDP-L-rhamnose 4-epimerase
MVEWYPSSTRFFAPSGHIVDKRVLMTGGAGFIGSFLADHFLESGSAVRVLDNLDPQVHPAGRPDYLSEGVELQVADVRDRAAIDAALDDVDVIVHCAAAVGVAQSLYRVQHYLDTNVGGTGALLEAIARREQKPSRLVVLTSMTGYGEGLYRRPSDGSLLRVPIRTRDDIDRFGWDLVDPETHEVLEFAPTPEDTELRATNIYALTKKYQEELSLAVSAVYDFPVTCLRMFNVYGPRQSLSNPYTGVLAIFLSRLLAGQAPVVYEDGRQTRDFISVHDVVRAVDLVVSHPAAAGQIFNLGTGIARPIGDIGRNLASLVGREELAPTASGEFRTGDIRHCVADASKIRDMLGFTPATDWEESLSELLEWSRQAPTSDDFSQAEKELRNFGLVSPARGAPKT